MMGPERVFPIVHFEYAPPPIAGQSFVDQLDVLRREHPVFRSDEAQGYWVFTRNGIITEALQQPEIFSSRATVPTIPEPPYQWIPLMIDPPDHTKWRKLLGGWFSPGRIATLETSVRHRCTELVDAITTRGSCDFVADFASQFPTTIFLQILGLPVDQLGKFMEWEDRILHFDSSTDPDYVDMTAAMDEVRTHFADLISIRRDDPESRGDDIVSAATDWKIDGQPISDDELLSCMLLLFMAGLDTVAAQLSFVFRHLATVPHDRVRLLKDPSLIPAAIEELLRAYPIVRLGRKVTQDIDFHGCPLRSGDMVAMPLAFATRDEDVYEDATEVRFDREPFRNFAFGAGPHRCLGSHLARRELIVAVEEWHKRIPEYCVAPHAEVVEHSGNGVYGLDHLPLRWPT
jgi:cytochrome P450